MPFLNAQTKKERTLTENILIITLLSALMASFIHYFFKESDEYNYAGFAVLSNNFRVSVNTIHAQWIMDNHPASINVASFKGGVESLSSKQDEKSGSNVSQFIPLNKKGWVDVVDNDLNRCEKIWQYVLEQPLVFMKQSISIVTLLKSTSQIDGVICQYSLSEGRYFEYDSTSGNVSKIMLNNKY